MNVSSLNVWKFMWLWLSLWLSLSLTLPIEGAAVPSVSTDDNVEEINIEEAAGTIDNHKKHEDHNLLKGIASPSGVTVDAVFDALDRNHDHVLTLTDFNSIDADNNEHISLKEFAAALDQKEDSQKQLQFLNSDSDETGGFMKGFTSSTAMIIATEIGDKTFFIAAVLSMRHPRLSVFAGAILALISMTIISTMMGLILPSFLPRQYTHIIGGLLFLYFGIKLIYDSKSMIDKVSDELEEVEEELGNNSKKNDKDQQDDVENPSKEKHVASSAVLTSRAKNIFFQCFLLTFMAEWGDRSQIATIALAAAKDPYGVTVGASFGHSLCTGLAVVGGRMLASRISEKTVSFWGVVIFLCFGVHAFVFDV